MRRCAGRATASSTGSRRPPGSAISPLLANIFLHYALDLWLAREFPAVAFERDADDAILHCDSEQQARVVPDAIVKRLARGRSATQSGQDARRVLRGLEPHRLSRARAVHAPGLHVSSPAGPGAAGALFVSFARAVGGDAAKTIRPTIRRWRLHLRSGTTLADLARSINAIVRGWINYYGRFYGSVLTRSLGRINDYLMGHAEVQTAARPPHPGLEAAGRHRGAPASPPPPLGPAGSAAIGRMMGAR
jgi:hypothetical protein